MIGHTIRGPRPFPSWTILWLLIALILVGAAIATRNPHPAIGAAMPIIFTLVWLFARPVRFHVDFTESGLELKDPRFFLPYGDIESVSAPPGVVEDGSGSEFFPIQVEHARGFLSIPRDIDVPSREVLQFLSAMTNPEGPAPEYIHPSLQDYYLRQQATFGADKVWSFWARAMLAPGKGRRGRINSLAFFLTGLAWLLAAALGKKYEPWAGIGLSFMLMGGFFWFLFWLIGRRSQPARNWQHSCLIISPLGLALVQGDLKGQLKWGELRDVKFFKTPAAFRLSASQMQGGLILHVEGAAIPI